MEYAARVIQRAEENRARVEAELAEQQPSPHPPAPRLWQVRTSSSV